MESTLSRSKLEPGHSGAKKHSRTPRPSVEAAVSLSNQLSLPQDDPGVAILAEMSERLAGHPEWANLLVQQATDCGNGSGTPKRVCNLLQKLKTMVPIAELLCAAAIALRRGQLLTRAVHLSQESWPIEALSKLQDTFDDNISTLEGQHLIAQQIVDALGEDKAMEAFGQAVQYFVAGMTLGAGGGPDQ